MDPLPPSTTPQFLRALTEAQPALRAFCEASLGHCEDAKDAWQQTNVVLWQKCAAWDPTTRFLSWALAVARYEVLAVIRDRRRERLIFDDDVARQMADAAVVEADAYDVRREALGHCTASLALQHRNLLTDHYVLGRPQDEIASASGMSLTALRVKLMRLRRALAACIEERLARRTLS